ncbi:MAG: hypothetical protein MUP70_09750 [Candidatus Aminicenantes bacterium]|nr:hypothetical protein [Candidatus Aminicenantes bacterium]
MANLFLTAFIISGFAFLILAIMMVHEVSKRGIKVNFWILRFTLFRHLNQYKELTKKETGRVGPLYYPAIVSINLTLVLLVVYLVFFV